MRENVAREQVAAKMLLAVLSFQLVAASAGAQAADRSGPAGADAARADSAAATPEAAATDRDGVIDRSTIDGKVLVGYQGWFRCEGDGSNVGWHHYGGKKFGPGHCGIDLWPDVRELTPEERFDTPFRLADGSTAQVFSSFHPKTVDRHFQWMRQYGIDVAMAQRFVASLRTPEHLRSVNTVLAHCRDGANAHGHGWAVMYDLSGIKENEFDRICDDWRSLHQWLWSEGKKDPAYLHHGGRPVVALWGCGFNDRPPYLEQWAKLIDYFHDNPPGGRCTVVLGVPTYWRNLRRDAIADPKLHEVIARCDVLSPWTVGRYNSPEAAQRHWRQVAAEDLHWCRERKIEYLPVVFPGFSWHNLMKSRGREAPLDQIPRRGGQFLWSQFAAASAAGVRTIYVAMFDEMDEGTAIFKCTNNPPVGESPFLTYEGLPSDHYLWLTGRAARELRSGRPLPAEMPVRGQTLPDTNNQPGAAAGARQTVGAGASPK